MIPFICSILAFGFACRTLNANAQIDIRQNLVCAIPKVGMYKVELYLWPVYHDFFDFFRKKMKNGAPIMEVKMPIGISRLLTDRDKLSTKRRKIPPSRKEAGKRMR